MIILVLIVLGVLFSGSGVLVTVVRHKNKEIPPRNLLYERFSHYNYRLSSYQDRYGSKAAYYVAKAFMDIPSKYRPFEANELARTLVALDIKWGEHADNHGHSVRYFEGEFNDWFWTCDCLSGWKHINSKHTCKLWDDYGKLLWEFHEITEAAKQQERAFKLSGLVEADPEHLNRLLTRARAESAIITQVTNELLGLPEPVSNEKELSSIAERVMRHIRG